MTLVIFEEFFSLDLVIYYFRMVSHDLCVEMSEYNKANKKISNLIVGNVFINL